MNTFSNPMERGRVVRAKRQSAINNQGEIGVVYDKYEIAGRQGWGIIFESGGYDGFSPEDVELFVDALPIIDTNAGDYRFANVCNLSTDYDAGYFNGAFLKGHQFVKQL